MSDFRELDNVMSLKYKIEDILVALGLAKDYLTEVNKSPNIQIEDLNITAFVKWLEAEAKWRSEKAVRIKDKVVDKL